MIRPFLALLLGVSLAFSTYDPLSISGEWLINAYKTVLSPLQGQQMCNFWPTCSQFVRFAIRENGFAPGIVMGADRLMRCHAYAWNHLDEYYFGITNNRLNDPPANHVAWDAPGHEPKLTTLIFKEDTPAIPDDTLSFPVSSLAFADHLYRTGEYQRSASEYLRISYLHPDTLVGRYAGFMAGEAFLHSGEPVRSRAVFEVLNQGSTAGLALYGTARSWFADNNYVNARSALEHIENSDLATRRDLLCGWSFLREHDFARAAGVLARLPDSGSLRELAAFDGTNLSHRSRALGTMMSVVIPGSGQIYSGRTGDGLYALLTVAASGLATTWFAAHPDNDESKIKVSLFGALTALFYAGNVYGANIAARDYNRLQERKYLARAEDILNSLDLRPEYSDMFPLLPEADSGSASP